ncbi:MAG: hypothetical protein MnENMB40S_15550 [Rhizobiaceae bacterium MnEN-MB40S]|nr:MAG: hypothetical protein MnENMB40S_15550 [Rhizobiaceae bacterium MnEN-MB40S]
MQVGVILHCSDEKQSMIDSSLEELHGRTAIGHVLDRISASVGQIPVVVVCHETQDLSPLKSWCRRAMTPLHISPVGASSGRAVEAAVARGWDAAVIIGADQVFVDTQALIQAVSLIQTGQFDHVTTQANNAHPQGAGLDAIRVAAFSDVPLSTIEGFALSPETRTHILDPIGFAPCPSLDLRMSSPEGRTSVMRVMTASREWPARLSMAQIIELAGDHGPVQTPWAGAAGPLMIAEIGGNHEGDFDVARAMAESAIRSGADCVKFQLYTGASLVSPVESPTRFHHFKKFELKKEEHIHLAEMCREAGLAYLASVWDEDMLEWIDPYLDFYKVGSGDLTAWPLLRKLAERGKPILLSTGLATLDETLQTIAQIQDVDQRYHRPEWLCVLQCTSMYPIPDHDANLKVMDTLRAATGLSIGYSDHTTGQEALRVAAAMGAEVLEFHFTDSRENKAFRDHKVSLVEQEVRDLKTDLEQIRALRGSPVKVPQESELKEKHEISFRRAVYLNRDVKAGETVSEADLAFLRPAHGTDARDASQLLETPLLKDVAAYEALVRGDHY